MSAFGGGDSRERLGTALVHSSETGQGAIDLGKVLEVEDG